VDEMGVFVKWLAHASFQIKAEGKIIYVDLEKYGEATEKADLILVTHSHTDHCDPDKIKNVQKEDTVIIAPEDCASIIGRSVKTLRPGEETSVDNIRVKAVEAYNYKRFRSPGHPYHPKGFGVGYLIKVEGKTIYHAGDTDFIPEMRKVGLVDVVLLPSGGTYTMDNAEAAEAAIAINPKIVIPMHRWDTNPEEFKKKVEANSNIKVMVLQEGEENQVT
jgi:L-ascorbate metabolism protein UlaG (beta-lactamase superfamily)